MIIRFYLWIHSPVVDWKAVAGQWVGGSKVPFVNSLIHFRLEEFWIGQWGSDENFLFTLMLCIFKSCELIVCFLYLL